MSEITPLQREFFAAVVALEELSFVIDVDASRPLKTAQVRQDGGHTYGHALAAARKTAQA